MATKRYEADPTVVRINGEPYLAGLFWNTLDNDRVRADLEEKGENYDYDMHAMVRNPKIQAGFAASKEMPEEPRWAGIYRQRFKSLAGWLNKSKLLDRRETHVRSWLGVFETDEQYYLIAVQDKGIISIGDRAGTYDEIHDHLEEVLEYTSWDYVTVPEGFTDAPPEWHHDTIGDLLNEDYSAPSVTPINRIQFTRTQFYTAVVLLLAGWYLYSSGWLSQTSTKTTVVEKTVESTESDTDPENTQESDDGGFFSYDSPGSDEPDTEPEPPLRNRRPWQFQAGANQMGRHCEGFYDEHIKNEAITGWSIKQWVCRKDGFLALYQHTGGRMDQLSDRSSYRLLSSGNQAVRMVQNNIQLDTQTRIPAGSIEDRFELYRTLRESPLNVSFNESAPPFSVEGPFFQKMKPYLDGLEGESSRNSSRNNRSMSSRTGQTRDFPVPPGIRTVQVEWTSRIRPFDRLQELGTIPGFRVSMIRWNQTDGSIQWTVRGVLYYEGD